MPDLENAMRKVLLVILIVFLGSAFAQKPSVQLILDVSGSMWLNLESGDTKIDAAKTVLIDFIGGLPSDSLNMGLRLYGATVSGIDPQSCTDSQLIIPIDGLDKGGLINTVQATDPKGGTPIVYALNEAIKDFDTVANDAQKLIILVTDGAESCGEDLDVAVQAVKAAGIDLQVIGFGLAEKAANTFESTGAFANAMSALELATALQETTTVITTVVVEPEPSPIVEMVEVRESDGYTPVLQNSDWIPVRKIDSTGIGMVLVPVGSFTIGDDNVRLARNGNLINFSEPFWIDEMEISRGAYQQCIDAGVCQITEEPIGPLDDNHPISRLDWKMAATYCDWRGARLPREAEWEYAARGPDGLKFPWGNEEANNFLTNNFLGRTAPIDSFEEGVSWVGAYNMAGNVAEWTSTLYKNYPYSSKDGREIEFWDARLGGKPVMKGGGFHNRKSTIDSANRVNFDKPTYTSPDHGVRCMRPLIR